MGNLYAYYTMEGITIADSPNSVIIVVDKAIYSKDRIEEALRVLKSPHAVDDSHIAEISDEEQAELEELLNAMTPEDREIASIHFVKA